MSARGQRADAPARPPPTHSARPHRRHRKSKKKQKKTYRHTKSPPPAAGRQCTVRAKEGKGTAQTRAGGEHTKPTHQKNNNAAQSVRPSAAGRHACGCHPVSNRRSTPARRPRENEEKRGAPSLRAGEPPQAGRQAGRQTLSITTTRAGCHPHPQRHLSLSLHAPNGLTCRGVHPPSSQHRDRPRRGANGVVRLPTHPSRGGSPRQRAPPSPLPGSRGRTRCAPQNSTPRHHRHQRARRLRGGRREGTSGQSPAPPPTSAPSQQTTKAQRGAQKKKKKRERVDQPAPPPPRRPQRTLCHDMMKVGMGSDGSDGDEDGDVRGADGGGVSDRR